MNTDEAKAKLTQVRAFINEIDCALRACSVEMDLASGSPPTMDVMQDRVLASEKLCSVIAEMTDEVRQACRAQLQNCVTTQNKGQLSTLLMQACNMKGDADMVHQRLLKYRQRLEEKLKPMTPLRLCPEVLEEIFVEQPEAALQLPAATFETPEYLLSPPSSTDAGMPKFPFDELPPLLAPKHEPLDPSDFNPPN